jgi:hypothetical protein
MKRYVSILLVLCSINLFSQEAVFVDAYNRGVFCTSLNSANNLKTPIRNIQTNVHNWLYLNLKEKKYISTIEIDFFERVYRPTIYEVRINNQIDTLSVNNIKWSIEINDTISTFSLNSIDDDGSPTIEQIKFIKDGERLDLSIDHKSKIDHPKAFEFHNMLETRLLDSKSDEIGEIKKLYEKEVINLLDNTQKIKVEQLFSIYYPDPKCEFFNLIHSFAKDTEKGARYLLNENTTSKWTRAKSIRKSKRKYFQASKLYTKAELIDCSNNIELTFKIISCLNHAEKFKKSEKLLSPFIKNSDLSGHFFSSYFMTRNKVSLPKELRENGFIYYSCGGSPHVIDSEHYYTNIILKNAALLFKEKEYWLLINYLKYSNIRINWSDDIRLNKLNTVICQMLIESLIKEYSKSELINEFKSAEIYTIEHDVYFIGDYVNHTNATMKLFEVPLKIYFTNPTSYSKYSKVKNEKPIIEYNEDKEDMKRKTIIHELLK